MEAVNLLFLPPWRVFETGFDIIIIIGKRAN